jgi:radical SAM enzyme (TIGR01210 family)
MLELRKEAATAHQEVVHRSHEELEQVIFTETRKSYLGGKYVDRLVLFLRGTGCTWAKDNGGCTFCGFWNATNFGEKISNEYYLHQVSQVLADPQVGIENYHIVSLYNDGSLFEEREIDFDVVLQVFMMLSQQPSIQRIVIETKVIDIDEEKVIALTEVLGDIELEIAVGFESSNDMIRDICVNKNFSRELFEEKAALLQRHKVRLIPLIMLKPPFLTEEMAIEDAVESLVYLELFGLPRIDFELATIEEHTLMHGLWKLGLYTPPRLWSLHQVLDRREALGLTTQLYISPPHYSVEALAYTENCPACNQQMKEAVHRFNRSQTVKDFQGITCGCKDAWQQNIQAEIRPAELLGHIRATFQKLLINSGTDTSRLAA